MTPPYQGLISQDSCGPLAQGRSAHTNTAATPQNPNGSSSRFVSLVLGARPVALERPSLVFGDTATGPTKQIPAV
jgi:hypothetical protein